MLIWLLQYGEPLPLVGCKDRMQRTGSLARTLTDRGHEVVWWTSTFDEYKKVHLFDQDTVVRPFSGLEIRLLHTRGYRGHVSFARLLDHFQLGQKFRRRCREASRPDLIYCSLPTLELSDQAGKYAHDMGVPLVIDVRDWWPDIFVDVSPRRLQWLASIVLKPLFNMARRACSRATAISGITPEFVEWGLAKAGRAKTRWDRDFPFGYSRSKPSEKLLAEARETWRRRGIDPGNRRFLVCFFGTIGKSFDLRSVVEAARIVGRQTEDVLFVLCGKGDRLEDLRATAQGLTNVLLPGWVGGAEIHALMEVAALGLDPLPTRGDFLASINNKAIEYMAGGLPVLSSPKEGALHRLLLANNCGASFRDGDAEELAAVVLALYRDQERVHKMSCNAQRVYETKFVGEKVYNEMADYLEQLAQDFGSRQMPGPQELETGVLSSLPLKEPTR